MLLLLALLTTRLLKTEHIRGRAGLLLANTIFSFLSAGVNVIDYFDVLDRLAATLVSVYLPSTVVTFGATVLGVQSTLRLLEGRKSHV